jgi:hypothetical protein
MKKLLVLLVFASVSIAQVDSVYTTSNLYVGEITRAMGNHLDLINDNYEARTIGVKEISRLVLKNGDLIIGSGISSMVYFNYTMGILPSQETLSDSLVQTLATEINNLNTDERSMLALERIAIVLTIQLGLVMAMLVITLIAS